MKSGPRVRPRLWLALALLGVLQVRLPAPLAAQEPRRGWELAPYAGLLAFDQDFRVSDGFQFRGLKDSPVFGGRLGYTIRPWLGVEGSLAYSTHSLDPSSNPGSSALDVRYLTYVAEAIVHLVSGRVIPFVAAGLGGLSFDVEAASAPGESSSVLVGSFGGGLKIPLAPSVLLRVDGRDFFIRQGTRELASFFGGDGDVRHNIGLSAGLALRFGGPGDADRDGIYDDRDTCPGTAADALVDESGCVPKVPEGPPPVKTDRDGDGVSDALDRCPNTTPGAVVDLEGCPVEEGGTPPRGSR